MLALVLEPRALLPLEQFALLRSGAGELLVWDPSGESARQIALRVLRWQAVDALVESEAVQSTLLGDSPRWKRVLRQVVEIAAYSDAPLLILGETGTGKELIARLVHALDARKDKQEFVVLDCTTIVDSLSGSEFFGHEKGAFTGAIAPRNGAFALADRGTLFLDEIGELPLALQAELPACRSGAHVQARRRVTPGKIPAFGWFVPRTVSSKPSAEPVTFVRICSTASPARRSFCQRSASGAKTFPCSSGTSCGST